MHRKRRLIIFAAVLVVWIAVGWLGTNPVCGGHPELRVVVATPQNYNLSAQRVVFSATDRVPLVAWWFPARSGAGLVRGTVILAHGGAGNRSYMLPRAAFLVRNGYNALAVDLRMHGESGGSCMSPGYEEARDLLGAVAYVRQRGERGPIILLGHSSGGVAALHAAAQSTEVAAVIADGAFATPDEMMNRVAHVVTEDPKSSIWTRMGLRFAVSRPLQVAVIQPMYALRSGHVLTLEKSSARSAVAALGARPVLFIGGAQDPIVPPLAAQQLYDAAPGPTKALLIVPGAAHNDTYRVNPELYESAVLGFLRRAIPP